MATKNARNGLGFGHYRSRAYRRNARLVLPLFPLWPPVTYRSGLVAAPLLQALVDEK